MVIAWIAIVNTTNVSNNGIGLEAIYTIFFNANQKQQERELMFVAYYLKAG